IAIMSRLVLPETTLWKAIRTKAIPRPEYTAHTRRMSRDGLARYHSRQNTGLPSSDGPGKNERMELETRAGSQTRRDPAARRSERPWATARIRQVASAASMAEMITQPTRNAT